MAATSTVAAPAQAKSKKLIVIGAVVALLLVIAAAAALFFVNEWRQDPYSDERPAKQVVVIPTFLPLENMVVNLADEGGDRFAQIGITLELQDEATATVVKQYMPSIRNAVLMLVSQRKAQELLMVEGKEKLAADVLREVSRPLSLNAQPASKNAVTEDGERRRPEPVRRVLFSSFIIQ